MRKFLIEGGGEREEGRRWRVRRVVCEGDVVDL